MTGTVRAADAPPDDLLDRLLVEHDTWLTVERGLAVNSLAAYRRDLRRYAEFLRERGERDPSTVREETVLAYVEELKSARDDDGSALYAPSWLPSILPRGGGPSRRPERGGRRAAGAPGHPQGAH